MIPLKVQHWRGPHRGAFAFTVLAVKRLFWLCTAVSLLVGAPPEPRQDAPVRRMQITDAKGLRFTRISPADGLSQTRVAQIVQDDRGFMWFGTQYGLDRYDGYNFKVFVHESGNPNSLGGAFITSLFKDRSGILWIGCDQSLDRFDPRTETFTHYAVDPENEAALGDTVVHVSQDRSGMMWLATGAGLYRLDPSTGRMKRFHHDAANPSGLSTNDVEWTGEDREGAFWVGTSEGLDAFNRESGEVTFHIPLRDGVQISFYEDRLGNLWILHATENGLAVFDRQKNLLQHYSFYAKDPPKGSLTGVMGMLEDQQGNLWLGSPGIGLLRFDRQRQQFVRYPSNPSDPESLAEDKVICLYQDREGNIWTGLHSKGPNHFNPSAPLFEHFRHEPGNPNSLDVDFVNAIYQDHEGTLWFGNDNGLISLDREASTYRSFTGGLGDKPMVITITEDRSGTLWAGTFGHGLNRFDRRTGQFKTFRHKPNNPGSLSNDVVQRLLVDHAGTLWVATGNGLDRFDARTERFNVYKVNLQNRWSQSYVAIEEDDDGTLWLGTHYSGLHHFDPASGKFTVYKANIGNPHVLSDNTVAAVLLDHSKTIWVATANGIDHFDTATATSTSYDTRDGLAGNAIACILPDSRGHLWISTNRGLSDFDPITKTFRNYSALDGLPGNDLTGWRSCFKSVTGEMFFGGFSGAVAFRPEKLRPGSFAPDAVLTDLRLAGISAPVGGDSPLHESISYAHGLTLSQAQSAFSLTFSALSYLNPAGNRFRYKLEGLDEMWHEVASGERLASYTTLPARLYKFRVQAATSNGPWGEPGTALEIEVLPPFWSTLWFRTTFIAIVLLAGWWFYRVRMLQIVSQLNMRLDERLRERTRIARDLHDTLLQSFQGLVLRFQAVHDLLPASPIKARDSLGAAIDSAAEAIAEGREAIQELRSGRNSSDDLVDAVTALGEEFRLNLAHGKPNGVVVAFDVVIEGTPRSVYSILRDDLYRITREAVGNAFRHAHAGKIEVEIAYDDRMLRLRIRDNGIGIDPKLLARGARDGHWGFPGMRERAKSIGGQFEVWSEVNNGTEVEVTIPGAIAYRTSDDDSPDSIRG